MEGRTPLGSSSLGRVKLWRDLLLTMCIHVEISLLHVSTFGEGQTLGRDTQNLAHGSRLKIAREKGSCGLIRVVASAP